MSDAGAPLEPPGPPPRPYAVKVTHLAALLAILALGAGLRLVHLGADPPLALSTSNAEVMDGPWYLADAIDTARGQGTHVPPQYRKPIITATAFAAFSLGGVSLETAHAYAAAWGILLVLLGAAGAYTAYGTRAGLLAALFLATSFVLVGYGRTPLVYGPLATGLAGAFCCFALGVRRHALFHVAAGAIVVGLAVGLKEVGITFGAALFAGLVVGARERGRALLLATGAVAATGVALYVLRPDLVSIVSGKMVGYLGKDADPLTIVKRVANAPLASGLAIRAFPLLAVAWLGGLAALAWRPMREYEHAVDRRADDSLDAALVAWLLVALLVHAPFRSATEGGGAPLRYFAPALVPAAILAARAIQRLVAGLEEARFSSAVVFAWALPAAYVVVSCAWILAFTATRVPESLSFAYGFFGVLAVALVLAALVAKGLGGPKSRTIRVGPALAAIFLVAPILASDGAWLRAALAAPTYTLRDANATIARALPPGSVVEGPFAHALTYDAPLERHFYEALRAYLGATHLVVEKDQAEKIETMFRTSGRPLALVLELELRGYPVRVYRFPWAAPGAPR